MKFISVEDIDAKDLSIYHTLRDNAFDALNSFVADSPKVVNILLETDLRVYSILATKEYYKEFSSLLESKNIDKLYLATKVQMQKIVGHRIHHNCMMHGIRPKETSIDALDEHILMLDAITSSENIGSIARSTAALGVTSFLVPVNAPHPYGRRALRVSMGHVSKLKINIYDDIFQTLLYLKQNGYWIYGAEVAPNSTPLSKVKVVKKWVLLMGHEGLGLSQEIQDMCDEILTIEMSEGVRSLNVAVASSLMMYQLKNQI